MVCSSSSFSLREPKKMAANISATKRNTLPVFYNINFSTATAALTLLLSGECERAKLGQQSRSIRDSAIFVYNYVYIYIYIYIIYILQLTLYILGYINHIYIYMYVYNIAAQVLFLIA